MPEDQRTEFQSTKSVNDTTPSWEEIKAQIESEGVPLDMPDSDEDEISVEEESASPAGEGEKPQWKDPEGWDQHYYPKDPDKLREQLRSDPETFRKVFGDPISDKDHVFHKPFAETQRNYFAEKQKAAELERLIATLPQPKDDGEVITAEMVDNGEATFSQYDAYNRKVSARERVAQERQRVLDADRREIETQEAEFRKNYPTESVDEVYGEFAEVTKDGKPNQGYKPMSITELHQWKEVRRAGGLEAYVQNRLTPKLEEAKREAVKEVVGAKRTPHLNSSDQSGTVTIPQLKTPRSGQEAAELMKNDPEGYDRFLATLPFLQERLKK